jgi:hypothetical protein
MTVLLDVGPNVIIASSPYDIQILYFFLLKYIYHKSFPPGGWGEGEGEGGATGIRQPDIHITVSCEGLGMASGACKKVNAKVLERFLFLYISLEDVITKTARRVSLREGHPSAQSLLARNLCKKKLNDEILILL